MAKRISKRRVTKGSLSARLKAKSKAVPAEEANINALRAEFKRLKSNALYCVSGSDWMKEVRKLAGKDPTPQKWVKAAEQATTKCDACSGSGVYQWGASVNGRMTHSGPCYRCESKGRQNQSDYCRNRVYDSHRKVV